MLKRILIISGIGVVLYFGAGFLAVFFLTYFSSPKRIESLPKEKVLFARLKKDYHLEKIERSPETEHQLLAPKDTLIYTLYLSKIDCGKSEEEMKSGALAIAKEINTLDWHPNFYKYEIFFYCKQSPPGIATYRFLRKDLK